MKEAVTGQLFFFAASIGFGACLLFLYDIIRSFRRVFIHKSFHSVVEDVVFWILVGVLSFRFLCWYNQGELRGFFFLGLFLGMAVYYGGISKKMIYIWTLVFGQIHRICRTIHKILQRPAVRMRTNIKWQLKKEKKHVKMALKKGNKRGDMSGGKKKI